MGKRITAGFVQDHHHPSAGEDLEKKKRNEQSVNERKKKKGGESGSQSQPEGGQGGRGGERKPAKQANRKAIMGRVYWARNRVSNPTCSGFASVPLCRDGFTNRIEALTLSGSYGLRLRRAIAEGQAT